MKLPVILFRISSINSPYLLVHLVLIGVLFGSGGSGGGVMAFSRFHRLRTVTSKPSSIYFIHRNGHCARKTSSYNNIASGTRLNLINSRYLSPYYSTRVFSSTNNSISASPSSNNNSMMQSMATDSQQLASIQPQTNPSLGADESKWSNYERLVRKLYQTNLFNPVKLGLDNMRKLHEILGRPMDQPDISIIHIAGSNGKGSVALKTANTFQRGNYKVGLFVSPHISSFRERIQINGVPISESQVEQYLQEIFDICEKHSIPATFFEVTTALAFHVFAKEGVEVVVLETGLGGRLDATNVINRPALSVITSIGLEHTQILGDTIEKIALEKGGIMKENCQVLVGKNVPWTVMQQCAKEKNVSEIFQCEDVLGPENDEDTQSSAAMVDYDAENSRIASAAVILVQFHQTQQRLSSGGQEVKLIPSDDIAEGVKIRPPCRFEEMDIPTTTVTSSVDGSRTSEKMVRVILDVAHNPQAMDYLIAKLKANYPNDNVRMVVGMSADKDLKYCTDILLEYVSNNPERIHLVEASHPRAASISAILKANLALVNSHYETRRVDDTNLDDERDESSVSKQVREALQLAAANNEVVVICGSVFIMADAREEVGIIEPRDSAVIAQVAGAGMRNSQENFGTSKGG